MYVVRCILAQDASLKLICPYESLAVNGAPLLHVPCQVADVIGLFLFQDQVDLAAFLHLADKFVSSPGDVVKLGQQVMVKVIEVDLKRKRISLSMRGM